VYLGNVQEELGEVEWAGIARGCAEGVDVDRGLITDRYENTDGALRVSLNQRPVVIPRSLEELIAMGDDLDHLSKPQLIALLKQFREKLVKYRDSINSSAGHKLNKTLACKREELNEAVDRIMAYYEFAPPEHGNSKRTLPTARAILCSVAYGHERTDAAHQSGVTRDFLDRWIEEDDQFKAAVLSAETAYQTLVIDESILRLSVGGDEKKRLVEYGKDGIVRKEEVMYTTPNEKVIIASKAKLNRKQIEVKGSVEHKHELVGIPENYEKKLKAIGDQLIADEIESDYAVEDENGQDRESES
jgi:hypothetical protein